MVKAMSSYSKCEFPPLHLVVQSCLIIASSHPESARYGQWYTPEEIIEIFAPPEHAVDGVKSWLHEAGIAKERISHSVNKQWIQFDAKVRIPTFHFRTRG